MRHFLAFSTNPPGFFCDHLHGSPSDENTTLPSDAVEITADQYAEFREGLCTGKALAMVDGKPVLVEYSPSDAELAIQVRAKRNEMLSEADVTISRMEDAGGDAKAWRAYRQALRDVPQQSGFPQTIIWPAVPSS